MALNIYFLRHGQTNHSRDNLFCGSGTDAALTEAGREMAQEFASAHKSTTFQALYVSPLTRAVDTATPLGAALGLPLIYREELREIGYGAWEGKTVESVQKTYPEDYRQWSLDPAEFAPTQGENARMIASRTMKVVTDARARFQSGNVLFVSHKASIRVMLCELLGIDLALFRYRLSCPVASLSIIEFGPNGPLLKCLADRTHLSERLRKLPGT